MRPTIFTLFLIEKSIRHILLWKSCLFMRHSTRNSYYVFIWFYWTFFEEFALPSSATLNVGIRKTKTADRRCTDCSCAWLQTQALLVYTFGQLHKIKDQEYNWNGYCLLIVNMRSVLKWLWKGTNFKTIWPNCA